MSALLYQLGGLVVVLDLLYLAWRRDAANPALFRGGLAVAAACLAGGIVITILQRAKAGMRAKGCPRCGRPVARGRMFCDEHFAETINRYRDEERQRGE
ncbi:MAG TPA: hypothetical protein VMQ62_04310 [Dongiaceae bacterium]|nr:hypothetical protein [Dongiaceae bacterium]